MFIFRVDVEGFGCRTVLESMIRGPEKRLLGLRKSWGERTWRVSEPRGQLVMKRKGELKVFM